MLTVVIQLLDSYDPMGFKLHRERASCFAYNRRRVEQREREENWSMVRHVHRCERAWLNASDREKVPCRVVPRQSHWALVGLLLSLPR